MIKVEELNQCKRLIENGYVAEIYLNKKGMPEPWGGIYHLTMWDKRRISKEMFLAIAEDFEVEERYNYLRIAKKV